MTIVEKEKAKELLKKEESRVTPTLSKKFPSTLAKRHDLSFLKWQSVQLSRNMLLPVWTVASYSTVQECNVARSPGALEHPLVPCKAWEGFLPPRSIRPGAFGHSQKPLRWL